ncbi:MAG TPA: LysM peptidoglycan-binding domain-containing protein [Virgibacillus sp.]|nr:LysM peptidoglycan-binding domain-containing protein [Virgibacillus sp.]
MSHEQNKFSFELNESLYFEKGQEVAEMMQISLDPEITIQPFNDYVSIRGVIELQGEYQKTLGSGEGEREADNFDIYHSYRYVESVTDTLEGGATFSHQFPVEISIPSYRVQDFNEITVSIESFDYEIPEENQLKLNAAIDIHGINMENANETSRPSEVTEEKEAVVSTKENEEASKSDAKEIHSQEKQEIEPIAAVDEQEEIRAEEEQIEEAESVAEHGDTEEARDKEFQAEGEQEVDVLEQDAAQEPEELQESRDTEVYFADGTTDTAMKNEEEDSFKFDIKQAKIEAMPEDETLITEETPTLSTDLEAETSEKKPEEKDRWKNKKSQSLSEFFKSVPSSESSIFSSSVQDESFIEPSPSSSHLELGESSSYFESRESNSEDEADVHYLSDMFRGGDEEQYTQMRLCIVQSKDTVETIAERYEIPILQLLKQNQLDGDDISEGQLLYIPRHKK